MRWRDKQQGTTPAIRSLLVFFWRLGRQHAMIRMMALREIEKRYAGTLAGLIWSVVHPLMLIATYWFVFSLGLRLRPGGNIPFVIHFLSGLIPWLAFSETVRVCTSAITANAHLVKKTVFPTEVLPVVHLAASMVTHLIMLVILLILMGVYGIRFSVYNVQFVYFLLAMSVFCIGMGWLVSALNVFYRDIGEILRVLLNIWFWLTPIVWPLSGLPEKAQFFVKLNPMYYIVHGYRASFIHRTGFWENWRMGAYFWLVALGVFALGGWVFRRLKPDFAEVM